MANLYSWQQYHIRRSSYKVPDATVREKGMFFFACPSVDEQFG